MPDLTYDVSLDTKSIGLNVDAQLFYPASGMDIRVPVRLFGKFCSDLHFADVAYFGPKLPASSSDRLPLGREYKWKAVKDRLVDLPEHDWISDAKYKGRQPKVRTHQYVNRDIEKEVRVHLHSRRAPTVLRQQLPSISVFFYRGDSDSDRSNGSGTQWLTVRKWHKRPRFRWLIFDVLNSLVDGGLLVTDGSMCFGENNPFRHLRQYRITEKHTAREIHEQTKPFEDGLGRKFECIGSICQYSKYYPSLIWKVNRM